MSLAGPSQSVAQTLKALFGIVFRRQSPERLHYSRERLVVVVIAAIALAIASHLWFFGMSLNHALVNLVFELGVLVVGLNLAWSRSRARHRLLKMTLALFLIGAAGDAALVTVSPIPLDSRFGILRQLLAIAIMLAQLVGAVNSVRFGIAVGWRTAAAFVAGYVAITLLLTELATLFL